MYACLHGNLYLLGAQFGVYHQTYILFHSSENIISTSFNAVTVEMKLLKMDCSNKRLLVQTFNRLIIIWEEFTVINFVLAKLLPSTESFYSINLISLYTDIRATIIHME